jgi:hypothetical protein
LFAPDIARGGADAKFISASTLRPTKKTPMPHWESGGLEVINPSPWSGRMNCGRPFK